MDHRYVPNKILVLAITLHNPGLKNNYLVKNSSIVGFLTKWSTGSPSGPCLYNTYY